MLLPGAACWPGRSPPPVIVLPHGCITRWLRRLATNGASVWGFPALSPHRLWWVSQNYVRAETIAAANERLLDVYRRMPLVQTLGDGHIATVDGMRFRVPVRSIHTGPNPRYFARGRGVTWLNYLSDQFAGCTPSSCPAPCATH